MKGAKAFCSCGGMAGTPFRISVRKDLYLKEEGRMPVEDVLVTKSRCAHLCVSAQLPTGAGSLRPNWRRRDILENMSEYCAGIEVKRNWANSMASSGLNGFRSLAPHLLLPGCKFQQTGRPRIGRLRFIGESVYAVCFTMSDRNWLRRGDSGFLSGCRGICGSHPRVPPVRHQPNGLDDR
jgi:hypothetical protein